MAQQFIGFDNILSVYWTLTIELGFYFFITVLYFLCLPALDGKIGRTFFTLGIAAAVIGLARWQTHHKLPVAMFLGLFVMIFGAIMRNWRTDERKNVYAYYLYYLFVVAVVCATAYSFETQYSENPYRYAIAYIVALVLFVSFSRIPDRYVPGWAVLLGEISFGMYLFHPIFLFLSESWEGSNTARLIGAFLCTIAVSFALHMIVERPCIAAGRRRAKRTASSS